MINHLSSILAAAYGPVNDIEIVWTLIASFGLGFSIYNFREARKDLEAVKLVTDNKRDRRYVLANQTQRAEGARIIIQTIFLLIGLMALSITNTPTRDLPLKLVVFSVLITWGLIVSASLLTLKSYWIFRLRNDLREGLMEEDLLAARDARDLARDDQLRQDLGQPRSDVEHRTSGLSADPVSEHPNVL